MGRRKKIEKENRFFFFNHLFKIIYTQIIYTICMFNSAYTSASASSAGIQNQVSIEYGIIFALY